MTTTRAPASARSANVGRHLSRRFSFAIRPVPGSMGELMSTRTRTVFPVRSKSSIVSICKVSVAFSGHAKELVGETDGLGLVSLHRQGGPDTVHRLRDDHGLLRDVDGEHDVVTGVPDRLLEDRHLVQVTSRMAEVAGVVEQRGVRVEAVGDPHHPDTRVRRERVHDLLLAHRGTRGGQYGCLLY